MAGRRRKKGPGWFFEVEGTCIGLQYRKSVEGPAPVARAVIDGRQESAVILDGNFEQTWGDCPVSYTHLTLPTIRLV